MCVSGDKSADRATKTKVQFLSEKLYFCVPNTRMLCLFCRVIIMGVEAFSPVKFFSKNNIFLFGYFVPVEIFLDNENI